MSKVKLANIENIFPVFPNFDPPADPHTAGIDHCFHAFRPSVHPHFSKSSETKQAFTAGSAVRLAKGIINDSCLVLFWFFLKMKERWNLCLCTVYTIQFNAWLHKTRVNDMRIGKLKCSSQWTENFWLWLLTSLIFQYLPSIYAFEGDTCWYLVFKTFGEKAVS